MSKLNKLSPEQLDEVCALHLDNYSYRDISDYIRDKFGIQYSHTALGYFFRSTEGKDRVEQVASNVREEWINEPLAEKSSRIHALREQATRIQRMLRSFPLEARNPDQLKEYLKLSAEFRGYVNQLRTETEPLRVQKDEKIVSPFEFLLEEKNAKQTSEVQSGGSSREEEAPISKVTVHPSYKAEGDTLS